MDDDDPTTADLFIAAVLKVAGPDGLAKVYAIAGGSQMSVAIHPVEGSVMVRALGMADARRVSAELLVFNAEGRPTAMPQFYLPRRRAGQLEQRRERIKDLRLQGKTKRDIAVELGITDATVLRDLKILQADGRLPLSLPSFHPRAPALPAPLRCEALPAPDPSRQVGDLVPPADEAAP